MRDSAKEILFCVQRVKYSIFFIIVNNYEQSKYLRNETVVCMQ